MLDKPRVSTRRDSISSVQYQIALALCSPAGLLDVDRADLGTDELTPVMDTVRVYANDELSGLYPERWPARVRVTGAGRTVESTAESVPGEEDHSRHALDRKIARFAPELATLGAETTALAVDVHHAAALVQLAELVAAPE
jgi:2-methylcitrate dehydratase PrpD